MKPKHPLSRSLLLRVGLIFNEKRLFLFEVDFFLGETYHQRKKSFFVGSHQFPAHFGAFDHAGGQTGTRRFVIRNLRHLIHMKRHPLLPGRLSGRVTGRLFRRVVPAKLVISRFGETHKLLIWGRFQTI